ncbi:MAG: hypothetical protein ACREOQ_14685 [Gemmatimonadales bacterium]
MVTACTRARPSADSTVEARSDTAGLAARDSAAAVALGCQLVSGAHHTETLGDCRLAKFLEDSGAYLLRFQGTVSARGVGPGSYGVAEVRIPKHGKTVTVTYFGE